jgi:hypothetical protein
MRLLRRSHLVAAIAVIALTIGARTFGGPTPASMASAASAFLASLTPEQRQKAAFAFASDERTRWHFIPTETFPRNGLTLKEMTEPQRTLAHNLLKAGLSQRGYLTATELMALEGMLGAMEAAQRAARGGGAARGGILRDSERYFFSIFGTPSVRETWGWRLEGHHISLHFTIVNGTLVAGAPAFFGSNPAEVREGPMTGKRILAAEEDAARDLMQALDSTRRAQAIVATAAPNDMLTMNNMKIDPLTPVGIAASAMTPAQRTLLMKLIDVYAGYMADDIAAARLAKIKAAGEEKITFAWAGTLERGQRHYYRVQGPNFLIEYDNTQNNANHIHSIWRDFAGDFGADLLRAHVGGTPHQ